VFRKLLNWPWAQATLWVIGILAMLVGAGGDYGPNWGSIVVGAVFVAAAIALGFLRLQRQRLERTGSGSIDTAAADTNRSIDLRASVPSRPREPRTDETPAGSQTSEPDRLRKPWWHGFVTLVAIIAGAVGARTAISYFNSPEQQMARLSDEALVERLERDVVANNDFAATFSRMKRDFPVDYDQFIQRMVDLVREGASEDRAFVEGRDFMAEFLQRHRSTMRQGSDESLAAFLDTQVRLLQALRVADAQTCARIIDTGQFEPSAGRALAPTTGAILNAANNAMFDAIMSGDAQPIQREPIENSEWLIVFERAEANGADMTVLSEMGTQAFSEIDAQRRCDSVTILYEAMNEAELNQRARFAVELLSH